MNLVSEALKGRLRSGETKQTIGREESELTVEDRAHVNDFAFDSNYRDVKANVPGLGTVGLTQDGAIRVDSEQLLQISKMAGLGDFTTESLENGTFLIHPQKKVPGS